MTIHDTSCLVLLALPYPTLLRRAIKTVSSQATLWLLQRPLEERKSIAVYCSRSHIFFFTPDYFKGLISWQWATLSHQRVTSSAKYTLTPLTVGYDIAPLRSPNLSPSALKYRQSSLWEINRLRNNWILCYKVEFDTGSSMTLNGFSIIEWSLSQFSIWNMCDRVTL